MPSLFGLLHVLELSLPEEIADSLQLFYLLLHFQLVLILYRLLHSVLQFLLQSIQRQYSLSKMG